MDREPEPVYGRELSAHRVEELGRRALERFQDWGREAYREQLRRAMGVGTSGTTERSAGT